VGDYIKKDQMGGACIMREGGDEKRSLGRKTSRNRGHRWECNTKRHHTEISWYNGFNSG